MLIIEPKLGTAAAAQLGLEVPADTQRKFTKFVAYNGTAASVAIKVYLIPKGKATDKLTCYVDYDLPARETYDCPEIVGMALEAGGTVKVLGADVSFSAVAVDSAVSTTA